MHAFIFLAAITLLSVLVPAVASGQIGDLGAKAPQEVIDAAASGRPQDVIVLFDDSPVETEAAELRKNIGADYDVPEIVSVKKSRYDGIKQRVLGGFYHGEHETLRDYSHLPMMFVRVKTLSGLARLLERPEVVRVYKDEEYAHFLDQSLLLVTQPQVAAQNRKGAGTAVAVLDTGVNYLHSAFGACSGAGTPQNCCPNNDCSATPPATPAGCKVACVHDFAPNDGQPDADGHGSNVSGIVVGVAPDTKIIGLDVFNGNSASSSTIIAAINWCIANKSAYNIVAVNMSLGGTTKFTSPCSGDLFAGPVNNARNAGILSAIASGNEEYINGISSPACVPAAVSVGAVYDSNMGPIGWSVCTDSTTAADKVTCFSNSAGFLTMLAPGAIISAAGWNMGGTSQAAPHIAGSIAVLKGSGAFPLDTADQTVARMTSTGVPVLDTRNGITKPRIDLLAATAGAGACIYSISPTDQSFGAAGGSGTVNVTAPAGCDWTAVSNAAWINVTAGSGGSGNGTVSYSAAQNTGTARTGTMTIAGRTFTASQADATGGQFSISGKIKSASGAAMPGVTVNLSGAGSGTTTTNSRGNFRFTGLGNGTYTLTPSFAGYTFTPESRTVNVNGANVGRQNFRGVQTP